MKLEQLKSILATRYECSICHDIPFKAGFDACWSHLAPVIEEMQKALEYYAHEDASTENTDVAIDALAKAREVLGGD